MQTTSPQWLQTAQNQAEETVQTLDLPTVKGKPGWEFTTLQGFSFADFNSYSQPVRELQQAEIPGIFDGLRDAELSLTTIDGAFDSLNSRNFGLNGGRTSGRPIVAPLELACTEVPELVQPHLSQLAPAGSDLFTAQNSANWRGGFFIHIPRGITVAEPIVLNTIHLQESALIQPRILIVIEEGAQAEVWSQTTSVDKTITGAVNGVVELVVGQNASLRFVDAQALSEQAWNFGHQRATVDRDGKLDWVTFGFGSASGKTTMSSKLVGPGAHGIMTGAYATRQTQHIDFDTYQEHAARQTTSDLAFRGILADRSSAVWRGMIKVDQEAQQTDAFQESRNLLLSKKAHADAIPGLEIFANDVRCTHAAAIAKIDEEQLFYLCSRGLDRSQARHLVIEGFLQELVERFESGMTREMLAAALERRLAEVI